jgi:choline/glycine/proline betaine transport protein
MEPWVFVPAALLTILFVVFSGGFSELARVAFWALQSGIIEWFGWFYILTVTVLLGFIIWLCCSRYGKIRLGTPNSEPEFSYFTWFAMLMSAGMGIGIVFFGAAEPMQHFLQPPEGTGKTDQALREAMRFTFYHWGLHPWAIYSAFALPISYFHFRHGLPLAPRSLLYPLIGERIRGAPGHAVDILCTIGTLFGVATSLGLGAAQVNAGLSQIFGLGQTLGWQLVLIAIITLIATISVVTGLYRGIQFLSRMNISLAIVIFFFVLITGPTIYTIELFLDGFGYYLQKLPFTSLHINPGSEGAWQAHWTLFYWSWWISWSPFVGIFVARVSKGRSIREFIMTALLVPTLGSFLWFSVIGGTGIAKLREGAENLAETVMQNEALAFFQVLKTLPLQEILLVLATILVVVFFITSSDSGSLVDDMVTSGGHPNPPRLQRVFWALAEGSVAAVLLYAGGLKALRTASLTSGLPVAVFLLIASYGLLRALGVDYRTRGLPSMESIKGEPSRE